MSNEMSIPSSQMRTHTKYSIRQVVAREQDQIDPACLEHIVGAKKREVSLVNIAGGNDEHQCRDGDNVVNN
jgi:hypothetical protein